MVLGSWAGGYWLDIWDPPASFRILSDPFRSFRAVVSARCGTKTGIQANVFAIFRPCSVYWTSAWQARPDHLPILPASRSSPPPLRLFYASPHQCSLSAFVDSRQTVPLSPFRLYGVARWSSLVVTTWCPPRCPAKTTTGTGTLQMCLVLAWYRPHGPHPPRHRPLPP